MSTTTLDKKISYSEAENQAALVAVKAHLIAGFLVFLLMMLAGATLRAAQGNMAPIGADVFYQFMTVHGAGMVGTAAIGGMAVLWYFLRQYVPLSTKIFWLNFGIFLTGVVIILGSIFLGKYGGAWTFLYPLPGISMGAWSTGAAAAFLLGLLIIGTGFLILLLDFGRAILSSYGSLGRALGLPQLFGKEPLDPYHPATVVAGTMVLIVDFIGIAAGAVVLVMMLVNLYNPEFKPDALLVKNLIYFFGHVIINVAIYSAVAAIYELLPRFTGRPYKTSKVFYAAWFAIVFMVMSVYPHHLYMDFPMPGWAMVGAQVLSYSSGLPVMVVTGYGALMLVYRSGIQWNTSAKLLMLSIFGWAAGGIPAVVDSMVDFNRVLHNTMWVPGHFHFYLLLGVLPMIFGFTFYLLNGANGSQGEKPPLIEQLGFYSFVGGALLFVGGFLTSGANGVPRRWAVHLEEWVPYAQWSTWGAILVILGVLLFTLRVLTVLPKAPDPALAPAH
ncbi:cbb3-type cytochrome c oxidase subunit I [Nitrosococcus watsonii]|uniref:Cytochrome c oxidase subunit I n=1 Tax=Nitrosococcus watsoni (strain C-113) TaxID=105559 RepID=D8KC76_NITWC|nr:cbb3-type cytochrome c oxidase subunit I [Nitrosococcus watsonii]ADJ29747.1 cytochrome c oxidase subunit I [Nitrosococcus watsonii C-113]